MTLLLVWTVLAAVSILLCSLLETTLFSVRISTLVDRSSSGSLGAGRLLDIKQSRIDDAIGAILILNTLASTIGLTLAGAQAAKIFGESRVGLFSAALTFVVLIVSEIIPKTMAARYAGSLAGFVGYTLSYLIKIAAPALVIIRSLIRVLARRPRERLTRRELAILVGRAPQEGAISLAESMLIGSLIYSREVTLADVMTPHDMVFMMDAEQTIGDLLASAAADAFSRIPLFSGSRERVVGYVSHREVLKAFALEGDKTRKLASFLRPIPLLPETMLIGGAIEQILQQHEALALVSRKRAGFAGLVTIEDLLEAILGMEITDEAEAVAKLRPAVAESRRRRVARLRRKRTRQGEQD
ncbi:CNNM domain-containing protein [Rhodoblastus sp.]|uniref:CNNM domain-containing protein n=1 Tax=Rhodoblastus sp. TaxID=1962975 RepID=UPI002619D4DF|nr:CNNM domain-containing protein [Rhodoblastus sp.]